MDKERNVFLDIIRGYACFLVVLGHVLMGIRKAGIITPAYMEWAENFIWTFHVNLFIFLSGYVYRITGEWRKKGSRIKFLKYKLINLGIPYVAFSAVYIFINQFVGSSVNNEFKIRDILFLWKHPVAQYWFLYVLFFLFVCYVFLSNWLENHQIVAVLFIVNCIVRFINIDLYYGQNVLDMSIIFGAGCCLKKKYLFNKKEVINVAMIVSHILLVFIAMKYSITKVFVVEQLIALLGIFASISFVELLKYNNFVKRILTCICKYSFPIYLLHTIFTAGIRIIFLKMSINFYWLHVVAGIFLGILIPTIVGYIAENSIYLNFFFVPSKTINILKKRK